MFYWFGYLLYSGMCMENQLLYVIKLVEQLVMNYNTGS